MPFQHEMRAAPAGGQAGAARCCHRAKCFWLGGWVMQRLCLRNNPAPEVIGARLVNLDRDNVAGRQGFGAFVDKQIAVDLGRVGLGAAGGGPPRPAHRR